MSKDKEGVIRVGIAGLGRAGWGIHVLALETMPDKYRVVSVYDPIPERQVEAKDRLGCCTTNSYQELLADEDVEFVVVAPPNYLHAPMSIDALKAGKHVMVEKPFATSLADADQMIATAKETGQLLTCHHNSRYLPDFMKVQEVLASGVLGRILFIRIAAHAFSRRWDWQTLKAFGGGNLNNNGPHMVDQALLLFGAGEPEVFCRLERTPMCSGDAEDHIKVILQAPNAPMIEVELTSACAYPQDVWLVMGTNGTLRGSRSEVQWKYFDPTKLPPRPVDPNPTLDRSYNREEFPWIEEKDDLKTGGYGPATIKIYNDLYETIRHGAPQVITTESVRRQIAVLQRCHELSPV